VAGFSVVIVEGLGNLKGICPFCCDGVVVFGNLNGIDPFSGVVVVDVNLKGI